MILKVRLGFRPFVLAIGSLLPCIGCATVNPWQRETLADPILQSDRNVIEMASLDHIFFSREAASGGKSVGGGGCGCN